MLTTLFRWGSKLLDDGEITFYQFMVAFMGVYFSGTSASLLFSFSSSMSTPCIFKQHTTYHVWQVLPGDFMPPTITSG